MTLNNLENVILLMSFSKLVSVTVNCHFAFYLRFGMWPSVVALKQMIRGTKPYLTRTQEITPSARRMTLCLYLHFGLVRFRALKLIAVTSILFTMTSSYKCGFSFTHLSLHCFLRLNVGMVAYQQNYQVDIPVLASVSYNQSGSCSHSFRPAFSDD